MDPSNTNDAFNNNTVSQPKDNSVRNILIVFLGCFFFLICIIVCILVIVPSLLAMSFVQVSDQITDQVTESVEDFQTVDETSYQESFSIGETVRLGDVEWQVKDFENLGNTLPSSFEYIDGITKEDTKFIKVYLSARNVSQQSETIWNSVRLVDSSGNIYDVSTDSYINLESDESSSLFTDLQPNITEELVNIYEVPESSTGLKLEVTDLNLFDPQKYYIDLGI